VVDATDDVTARLNQRLLEGDVKRAFRGHSANFAAAVAGGDSVVAAGALFSYDRQWQMQMLQQSASLAVS